MSLGTLNLDGVWDDDLMGSETPGNRETLLEQGEQLLNQSDSESAPLSLEVNSSILFSTQQTFNTQISAATGDSIPDLPYDETSAPLSNSSTSSNENETDSSTFIGPPSYFQDSNVFF